MATQYCKVENNEIVWGPKLLPKVYKGVAGFPNLSNEALAGYNFYPVVSATLAPEQEYGDPIFNATLSQVDIPAVDIDIEKIRSRVISQIMGIRTGILNTLVKSEGVSSVYETNVEACELWLSNQKNKKFGERINKDTLTVQEYLDEMAAGGPYANTDEFVAFVMSEYYIGKEIGRLAENAYVKYKTLAVTATILASLSALPGEYTAEMEPYTSQFG